MNPFSTRGQLERGSSAKTDAIASARTQPSAGKSTGVRSHRAPMPPEICQRSSVSAAHRTSAIDIGATLQGSAAARRRKESADAWASASRTVSGLAVRFHCQLGGALPRERARPREAAPDHRFTAQAVLQQLRHGLGPYLGLARGEEYRGVTERLLERARGGGEDGRATGHGFEGRKPESFVHRGLDVECRSGVEERQVVLVAQGTREMDAGGNPRALRALRERMREPPRRTRDHEG